MFDIPLTAPSINGNEWKYVKDCIDSEWVSSAGRYVELLEETIAEYVGVKYGVACVNGTAALQVSIRVSGVQPGDEVLVPTLTFIATVNAIAYNGASPVFMDADKYYNLDCEKTIDFICNETELIVDESYDQTNKIPCCRNKVTGCLVKAIVPVHVWGNAVRMEELLDVCRERNIEVIEDASEGLGTRYRNGSWAGRHVGSVGQLGCLSFNGNKIITAGGGGLILTNNSNLSDRARYLTTQAKDEPVKYIHHEIGYNFRLTNLQAAVGLAQFEQLQGFLEKKKKIFEIYRAGLSNTAGVVLSETPGYADNNHWMNVIEVASEQNWNSRDHLMGRLAKKKVESRPVWALNHSQTPYQQCQAYRIERAPTLVEKGLCLPSSVGISDDQINYVISEING